MKKKKFLISLFTILFFIVLLFALYPRFYRANYLFAEDAGVFINDYLHEGLNIFKPFGGYLVVFARLIAIFVVSVGKIFNDFNVLAFTMKGCNVLFVALVAYYFTTDRFSFLIKSRKCRTLVMALLLIAACQYVDIILCTIGTHWWGGILVFFAVLELLNNQLPSKWAIVPLILCILSSPSGLLMGFGILAFIINNIFIKNKNEKKISFWSVSFIVLMVVVLGLQAFFILFKTDVNSISSGFSIKHLAESLWYAYQSTIGVVTQVFGVNAASSFMSLGLGTTIGGIIWVILAYFAKKEKKLKYIAVSFVSIFFLYMMVYYKVDHGGVSNYYNFMNGPAKHIWYHFMPFTIILLSFAVVFVDKIKKENLSLVAIVFIIIALQFIGGRTPIETKINTDLNQANEYLDFNSNNYAIISVAPYAETQWYTYVHVPVKTDYCSLKKVKCEKYDR